jgi:hypothetical protein
MIVFSKGCVHIAGAVKQRADCEWPGNHAFRETQEQKGVKPKKSVLIRLQGTC